jgi:predicted  nucleic acid-binding Zn-ribbon protein
VSAKDTVEGLQRQLTEAWAQKAQLMDKIQSLTVAIQGVQLGQQEAAERTERARQEAAEVYNRADVAQASER